MKSSDLVVGHDYLVNKRREWQDSGEFSRRRVLALSGWTSYRDPWESRRREYRGVLGDGTKVCGWVRRVESGGLPLLGLLTPDGDLAVDEYGYLSVEVVQMVAIRGPWGATHADVLSNIAAARRRRDESLISSRLHRERLEAASATINAALPDGQAPVVVGSGGVLVPLATAEWLAGQLAQGSTRT